MKIYNEDKTKILTELEADLEKGYFKEDIKETFIPEVKGVEEQGHYKVLQTYPNGGQDVEWVVDVPGVPSSPEKHEKENILVYIPYTSLELKEIDFNKQISTSKQYLEDTDYVVLKMAEAQLQNKSAQLLSLEYEDILNERQSARDKINFLEGEILAIGGKIW